MVAGIACRWLLERLGFGGVPAAVNQEQKP